MARKSSYGRITVAEVFQENNAPMRRDADGNVIASDLVSWEKNSYALMSDGNILSKHQCKRA